MFTIVSFNDSNGERVRIDDDWWGAHDVGMNNPQMHAAYIWFDLEFTDLDPAKARILQVAVLATDVHLQPLPSGDQGLNLCLKLAEGAHISPWVEENLADLLARCRSAEALPPETAARMLVEYMDRVVGPPAEDISDRPVLAGNSVHMDWRLACQHFPRFIERLHYRMLDVSSLKLQWAGWLDRPEFDKDDAAVVEANLPFSVDALAGQPHDAHYDILASIAELHYYRQHMLQE